MAHKDYASLTKAFEKADKVLADASGAVYLHSQLYDTINLSGISDILIRDCGRFAEAHSSDFLIDWDTVKDLLKPHEVCEKEYHVVCFGIRKNGVDHNDYIISTLRRGFRKRGDYVYPDYFYRRILALGLTMTPPGEGRSGIDIKAELKDITSSLYALEPEDEEELP